MNKTTLVLFSVLSMGIIHFPLQAKSELMPETAYDCTMVQIAEIDPSKLTKAEQIALLEQSLFESVDKYSNCIDQVQTNMTNASPQSVGSAAAGNGSIGGTSSQEAQAGTSQSSTAQNNNQTNTTQSNTVSQQDTSKQASEKNQIHSGGGAKNQVIAPKDNDSIVCSMLYEEIQNETDKATKAGLVDQYKNYGCG